MPEQVKHKQKIGGGGIRRRQPGERPRPAPGAHPCARPAPPSLRSALVDSPPDARCAALSAIIELVWGAPQLHAAGIETTLCHLVEFGGGGPGGGVGGNVDREVRECARRVLDAMERVVAEDGDASWKRVSTMEERYRGWFNLLEQVAVTTGISYDRYKLTTEFAQDAPANHNAGMINTFQVGVRILRYLDNVSVWWHAVGTTSLVVAILAAAPNHQSGKFVFRTFIDGTSFNGVGWSQRASSAHVALISILISFDASAHMTEGTHNAAMSGPIGIVVSISIPAILRWFFILGLPFTIQDYNTTIASPTGQPVTQIFLDIGSYRDDEISMAVPAEEHRTNDDDLPKTIVISHTHCSRFAPCRTFSITSNSRMMYASSHDGAIPGSKFLHKVDRHATFIATIGPYISYGIPIVLRVIYVVRFVHGPFHLGSLSYPIATAAVLWIALISIAFCLPQLNPVSTQTLNYAPVAVGIVIAYALGFWLLSSRTWFTGPITAEEMGIDITDLAALAGKEPEFLEKS
ncbi:hypothetical protein BJV78DRAFT_1282302 [Lactifluus subvellereus]|nr:hypothetical protein BJV78DRAFT_1282302 [Lactifluus subvellereus]